MARYAPSPLTLILLLTLLITILSIPSSQAASSPLQKRRFHHFAQRGSNSAACKPRYAKVATPAATVANSNQQQGSAAADAGQVLAQGNAAAVNIVGQAAGIIAPVVQPAPAPSPSPSPSPSPAPAPANNNNGASQSEPNGAQDWLNSGIEGAGWQPPFIRVSDLKVVGLRDHLNGVYAPCAPHVDAFESIAGKYGLPPILLAAIAMQESSCRAWVTGPNGEQGLMQITVDKCAPGVDCKDPWFNIEAGAKYLSSQLDRYGGSFLKAVGTYNGWEVGMTKDYATRQQYTACFAQNNLDYLTQMCNGWIMGIDGRSLGRYKNLARCG